MQPIEIRFGLVSKNKAWIWRVVANTLCGRGKQMNLMARSQAVRFKSGCQQSRLKEYNKCHISPFGKDAALKDDLFKPFLPAYNSSK